MSNIKKGIYLLVLLTLILPSIQPSPVVASNNTQDPPNQATLVDPQVWQAVAAAPDHQASFVVRLLEVPGEGPESAIPAQFRLENALELFLQAGTVQAYRSYYGDNVIRVTGKGQALRFLADWPEVAGVSIYISGQPWELRAQEAEAAETTSATGHITGRVTALDGVTSLTGMKVTAYRQTSPVTWVVAGSATTNASGDYDIASLPTGIYRAKFEDLAGNYATQFYNNKVDFTFANNFNVTDGQTTPNINAALFVAGKIAGTITEIGAGNTKDVVASAWFFNGANWTILSSGVSANNGTYTIGSLPPGTYRVKFSDVYDPPRYLDEWFDNKTDVNSADNVTVSAGQTIPNINAAMGWYGQISGNVKAFNGTTNLSGITVDIFQFNATLNDWEWVSYATTDTSGNYQAYGLITKNYRAAFSDPFNQYVTEYYNDKPDILSANDIHVDLGLATSNINAQLAIKTDTVNYDLVAGWNLVSMPVTLGNNAPSSAFASILGSHGDIYAWNCSDTADPWKLYNPALPPPVNDLTTTSVTQGYWVKMTAPGTLTLNGTHPLQTQITLCTGWNLIGYPSVSITPVGTALSSISGKYNLVWQYQASDTVDPWKSFNPTLPSNLNDLKNMGPGYGYWIRMTQAATLTLAGR